MFICIQHGWSNPMYECPKCNPVKYTTSSSASDEPYPITRAAAWAAASDDAWDAARAAAWDAARAAAIGWQTDKLFEYLGC